MQETDGIRAKSLKGFRCGVAGSLAAMLNASHPPGHDSLQMARGRGKDVATKGRLVPGAAVLRLAYSAPPYHTQQRIPTPGLLTEDLGPNPFFPAAVTVTFSPLNVFPSFFSFPHSQ